MGMRMGPAPPHRRPERPKRDLDVLLEDEWADVEFAAAA